MSGPAVYALRDSVGPVQRQLEAYNQGDTAAFVACYAPDAILCDIEGEVIASGRAAMRERYGALFSRNPQLHAVIRGRLVADRTVIDHEYVSGYADSAPVEAFAIYEVMDGLIRRAWFRREPRA